MKKLTIMAAALAMFAFAAFASPSQAATKSTSCCDTGAACCVSGAACCAPGAKRHQKQEKQTKSASCCDGGACCTPGAACCE